MTEKELCVLDQPVDDLAAALEIFQSNPEDAWRKVMRWDPGCDIEQSVLVWNRGLVRDCDRITWEELFAMLAELSRKARRSVDALCSLSTKGCTKAVMTRAVIDENICRNRQWDLTVRVYFKCIKP
jgi:hypothetical protein